MLQANWQTGILVAAQRFFIEPSISIIIDS